MNFKPGAVVMLLRAETNLCTPLVGTVQTLLERDPYPRNWVLDGVVVGKLAESVAWHEDDMKVIDPGPGNEHWVTQSRKSLPRPTPVTGPVTIDERGEVEQ